MGKGYDQDVVNTMIRARRDSSLKLYSTYIEQWKNYCLLQHSHYIFASVTTGLAFLQTLLIKGIGYSALNTARSALSSIITLDNGQPFGQHQDVRLYMKGAFNMRPPKPRYLSTWDPSIVLDFLQTWYPAQDLHIDKLVMKVALLIMLVTGQRPQLLSRLRLDNLRTTENTLEFALEALDLKHSRLNFPPQAVVLRRFTANPEVCVFRYLQEYLQRTAIIRKDIQFVFLTTTKPYRVASANTISRWLKTALQQAGVDITYFSAGSSRSASTSAAKKAGMPIDQILKAGGWSQQTTFTKFYDRQVGAGSFEETILSQATGV